METKQSEYSIKLLEKMKEVDIVIESPIFKHFINYLDLPDTYDNYDCRSMSYHDPPIKYEHYSWRGITYFYTLWRYSQRRYEIVVDVVNNAITNSPTLYNDFPEFLNLKVFAHLKIALRDIPSNDERDVLKWIMSTKGQPKKENNET